jgi:tripartite-type tricarboxylate transporter receptor subunit TctC
MPSSLSPAKQRIGTAVLAATLLLVATSSRADDFFAGKTITLMAHTAPGGGYDTYLRLLARHMGHFIPGHPALIVTNKPGGGGLLALNHAGNIAPRDGTFMTLVQQAILLHEPLGRPGLQISLRQLNWIGNLSQSNNLVVTWHTSPVMTIEDAKVREATLGASGTGSTAAQLPAFINAILGTRFKLVLGYDGGTSIQLAMQRGEVEGRGANTWSSYKATTPNEVRDGKYNLLIQVGLRKEPDLPNVPLLTDLSRGDVQKEPISRFVSLAMSVSRPLAAPPNVPADRVAILRRAFDATMKDPAFLAEAGKLNAEIDPMNGQDVQDAVDEILSTPKDVIDRIKAALGQHKR